MKKLRVLLVDDHVMVLEGFKRLIEDQCEVVGMVEDGRTLLEVAPKLKPDIVTMDISMPWLNGLDAARRLKKEMPDVKIIFLTMHADVAYVREAFAAGASGFLMKRSAGTELLQAIHAVSNGQYYITSLITKDLVRSILEGASNVSPQRDVLTPRQREVLQLVAEGRSVKEIATILTVSAKTVEYHKTQIMEQLNLHTTAELTKYAIAHGLIPP
jgi:DNA-binding NarL/FixJ family response regulator